MGYLASRLAAPSPPGASQTRLDCNTTKKKFSCSRCWWGSRTIQHPNPAQAESSTVYFTHFCMALDDFQPALSDCRKCGNLLAILEHFLLSWRAALMNQEGINESTLIELRKSWNFTSGPQWETCSVCFSSFPSLCVTHSDFFFLYTLHFFNLFFLKHLLKPHRLWCCAHLISVKCHNISPSLSFPRPLMALAQPLLTRICLHGNGNQAHSCLDAGGESADARENLFTCASKDAAYTSISRG